MAEREQGERAKKGEIVGWAEKREEFGRGRERRGMMLEAKVRSGK